MKSPVRLVLKEIGDIERVLSRVALVVRVHVI
jgi:hypothetical protein